MNQQYDVVQNENLADAILEVNAKLAEGWKAVGGIECNRGLFQQAIVLEEKTPVKDYVLVTGADPEALQKEVNSMLQNGWRLHDGPTSYMKEYLVKSEGAVIHRGERPGIAQAMVK